MKQLSDFERHVLAEVIGCPKPTLEYAVLRSIVDFAERSWIFRKSFNVDVDEDDFGSVHDYLDTDVSEYVTDKVPIAVSSFKINGVEYNLKYMELQDETSYIDDLRMSTEKLFYFPNDTTIRVFEMVDGMELFFTVVYKPTYDITEIDDVVYNDWLDPITAGAKARLMVMPNQPWTDTKMAAYYLSLFKRGFSEAKRRYEKNYTNQSGHVNWRSFGA